MIGVDLEVKEGRVEEITVWETDDPGFDEVRVTFFERGFPKLGMDFSEEGLRFLVDELQRKLR